MRFRTTVQLGGRTATGLPVPPEVVAALGAGKRPPVRVALGGYTYRSTVAPMGGQFLVPLSAEHRAGAGVQAGDEVEVDLEVDSEPRTVAVPDDLNAALDAEPAARRAFDALSYSAQSRHVLSVEGAKTAETRARRVARAVQELGAG